MDHQHARPEPQRTRPAPGPPVQRERARELELLALQRTAGNRAVAEVVTTVQRHHLDPEAMDEQQS